LHDLGAAITSQNLQIGAAKITTYGEKVVDVFYVKDIFGLKLERAGKVADLQKALLAVLDTVAPPEPKAARPARVRSRAKIAAE
jgi:[protein-PII] uridylyltransferase